MSFRGSKLMCRSWLVTICLGLLMANPGFANPYPDETIVSFDFPGNGIVVDSPKPPIRCSVNLPVSEENLLVLLNGIDITNGLTFTANGFEFIPVQPLPSVEHQLYITVYLDDGSEIEQNYTFSTRHQGVFDQASSDNQLSAVYDQSLKKSSELSFIPQRNLSANIGSNSLVTIGNWQVGFNTNLRYLERSATILSPEKKGFDLIDYRASGRYTDEDLNILVELGDLQLQETQNTIMGLARLGASLTLDYRALSLGTFMVQSEQVFGIDDGLNLDFDKDKNIKGATAGVKLFSDTLEFRTIFVTGGEKGSSFGIYTDGGTREGEVLAFLAKGQFWEGKLNLEAEYDRSEFDPDTSDEFDTEKDQAWSLKANGYASSFNYQAIYEYVGPDYEVIGNQGLQRDREGFTISGGAQSSYHSLNISGSYYEDNVDKDSLFPQTSSTAGMADYTYTGLPDVPMGLSYQRSILDSTMVPEFGTPVKTYTDIFAGRINFLRGAWNFGLNANYSVQNDKTTSNYDTNAQTYSFMPMYYSEHFSFSPNFSFNRSTDETRDVDTDTYTMTIDLRGDLFSGTWLYELAGTFNRMKMSNNALDMDTINSNCRIAYVLGGNYFGFLNPSIGLRGLYNMTDDKLLDQNREEFALLLAISTNIDISL